MRSGSVFMVRARAAAILALAILLSAIPRPAYAGDDGPNLIRDAEIEGLLRLYTKSIFSAAGLNPGTVHVYIIDDFRINAFVAGGQRIFINTGLLTQAK